MNKIITAEQKREIVELSADHFYALVAYGGDMYKKGVIDGAIAICIGGAIGYLYSCCWDYYKKSKTKNVEGEESV